MKGKGNFWSRRSAALTLMALLEAGLICLALAAAAWGAVATAWVQRYNGPGNYLDGANALAVDGQGNVFVTGYSRGSDTGTDYATIKYSPGGQRLWVRRYNPPANGYDEANAIAVDGQGNVYVTGCSESGNGTYDYATIKYGPGGQRQWVSRYNGPGNNDDLARAIAVDAQGNVYVTGWSCDYDAANDYHHYDYATIKYDAAGQQQWVRRYNGPGNLMDQANAIAVDGQGNVYVTGSSMGSGAGFDCATIKYSPSGEELWVRRYNGPKNGSDEAYALALDGQGNVCVAGWSESGAGFDCATIKYSPSGEELWVRRYNGPGNPLDGANAIAVDGQGNVCIAGWSDGLNTDSDYATIKYNPGGGRLWVRRYNGVANGYDRARAIAVDGQGNVYVTGSSPGFVTGYNYATIKYSPSGQRLWVMRYNGPGNGYDEATAIAVDSGGNVYVTGSSEGDETDLDWATIKYTQD